MIALHPTAWWRGRYRLAALKRAGLGAELRIRELGNESSCVGDQSSEARVAGALHVGRAIDVIRKRDLRRACDTTGRTNELLLVDVLFSLFWPEFGGEPRRLTRGASRLTSSHQRFPRIGDYRAVARSTLERKWQCGIDQANSEKAEHGSDHHHDVGEASAYAAHVCRLVVWTAGGRATREKLCVSTRPRAASRGTFAWQLLSTWTWLSTVPVGSPPCSSREGTFFSAFVTLGVAVVPR